MDKVFINEARKLWAKLKLIEKFSFNYLNIELNEKLLSAFQVGSFYYYVMDVRNFRSHFMSPKIKEVLGYDADKTNINFLISKIHPYDKEIFINHEDTVVDFFNKLPIEKFTKYKVSHDYRILNSQDKYIRILHQALVLQHEDESFYFLVVHTDITNIKKDSQSKLSFIGLHGESSHINVPQKNNYILTENFFSKREKEIINHIIKGKTSAEIAEILSISIFTVEAHRKNILDKINAKNNPELIDKIVSERFINTHKTDLMLYCTNCNQKVIGNSCSSCGQPKKMERIN